MGGKKDKQGRHTSPTHRISDFKKVDEREKISKNSNYQFERITKQHSLRAQHEEYLKDRDGNRQRDYNEKLIKEGSTGEKNLADFIDYRAEMQTEAMMVEHKDEVRRMLDEQRNDSHMQIEHHFRNTSKELQMQRFPHYGAYGGYGRPHYHGGVVGYQHIPFGYIQDPSANMNFSTAKS